MVYAALLPLMRTSWLPEDDRTEAPADLNGLVRFAERRNLFSVRVPSHFQRRLPPTYYLASHRTATHEVRGEQIPAAIRATRTKDLLCTCVQYSHS